jgi:hypothetical protein
MSSRKPSAPEAAKKLSVAAMASAPARPSPNELRGWCDSGPAPLDQDMFNLIERHIIRSSIVQLGCPGAGMVRHGSGLFNRTPFLRYAVIPVARNVWLSMIVWIPAASADA